ncbi:MAG: BrnT family toxin [Polaromonas sp.]|nr:BrnT family toxin [Polaromonas sp.]
MEFTWSETKRAANIKAHGLELVDAESFFEGMTFTFEDDRFSYGEQRFVTLGMLAGITVSVVHTENENEIRLISFRKATQRESQIYFDEIQN